MKTKVNDRRSVQPKIDSGSGIEQEGEVSQEPGVVRQISRILEQLPKGSREYQATSSMLEKMEEFFQIMQEANSQELDRMLANFDLSEQPLLQGLGNLVRKFHTQIKMVSSDVALRLGEIAEHDMVSATQRLEHIVEMTEEAANTTMNLSEEMMQVLTEQQTANDVILERLDQSLGAGELQPQTEKILREAADALRSNAAREREYQQKLTEILMAQGYQDLTGQVIQKIVALLEQLEEELLELVKAFGTTHTQKDNTSQPVLEGPQSQKSEVRKSQDEADELLKSLGF